MVAQRIELGRHDAPAAAGCGCHGEHAPDTAASIPSATGSVTELAVDGMTCDHCVRAVTTELTAVPGVDAVEVRLVAGGTSQVRVRSELPLDRAAVAAAIDEAGYTLRA